MGVDGRTVKKMMVLLVFDVRCPVLRRRPRLVPAGFEAMTTRGKKQQEKLASVRSEGVSIVGQATGLRGGRFFPGAVSGPRRPAQQQRA